MAGAPAMAGGGGEAQVQSSFPGPPMMFINKYSDEAVQRDLAPKPPPVPAGSYMMFGQQCHQDDLIIRPLEMQGLQRLHPQVYDRRKELKKLTVSILCNFLDLLDILVNATASQEREKKIEDLNLLFIHIHHLINEFRPHQARETLKVMMEMQQTQMLDVAKRLCKRIEKAGSILSESSAQLAGMQAEAGNTSDLLLMNEEEMNVDSLLNTPGCESVEAGDATNSTNSAPMETDPSDVVKEIYEKDKILTGLINDLPD